jgi:hypothetical protein
MSQLLNGTMQSIEDLKVVLYIDGIVVGMFVKGEI